MRLFTLCEARVSWVKNTWTKAVPEHEADAVYALAVHFKKPIELKANPLNVQPLLHHLKQ
jgi:hypothetical protein